MIGRTNSVLRRNAKTKTHLQPDSEPADQENTFHGQLEKVKNVLGPWAMVFNLMQVGGCRINEILKAQYTQISNEGGLHIKGSKGSNDRYIFDARCSSFLLKMKKHQTDPFHQLNIYAAIRLLKKHGIVTQKKGRVNQTVTGIFRNEKAKQVRNVSQDESLTANVLGHKSQKSTSYYGTN